MHLRMKVSRGTFRGEERRSCLKYVQNSNILCSPLTVNKWFEWFGSLSKGHVRFRETNSSVLFSRLLSHCALAFGIFTLHHQFPELVCGYMCGVTPQASRSNTLKAAGATNTEFQNSLTGVSLGKFLFQIEICVFFLCRQQEPKTRQVWS